MNANLELLPVGDETRTRLRRFIQMHAQHGGIYISIIDRLEDKDGRTHILVCVESENRMLTDTDLLARAVEVFSGELPEHIKVHFAIRPLDMQHILTADAGFVWWRVKSSHLLAVTNVWPPTLKGISNDVPTRVETGASAWVGEYVSNNHLRLRKNDTY